MSRWTRESPDELLEELRGRDRASPFAADVLQVGDVALERILEIVVEREPPDALARQRQAAWTASVKGSSLLKRPAILVPRATMQAPGQGREVEHAVGLPLDGEAQGVGQDQPPSASVFRTSTVLPLRIVRTSPSFIARPPSMFSVRTR
jgi:hypothetical protein